mmetsp:Transcript_86145/g.266753  ORF Transcript_86145/g.266753 Transcript_86145/m.266753 type:complete len:223 (+) Transcript_86145:1140-1808(+)
MSSERAGLSFQSTPWIHSNHGMSPAMMCSSIHPSASTSSSLTRAPPAMELIELYSMVPMWPDSAVVSVCSRVRPKSTKNSWFTGRPSAALPPPPLHAMRTFSGLMSPCTYPRLWMATMRRSSIRPIRQAPCHRWSIELHIQSVCITPVSGGPSSSIATHRVSSWTPEDRRRGTPRQPSSFFRVVVSRLLAGYLTATSSLSLSASLPRKTLPLLPLPILLSIT